MKADHFSASQATGSELDRIAAQLQPILEKYGVLRAVVFGSLARNEGTRRSDLDLIIVLRTRKRFLDRYDDLLPEIARAALGLDVDLLIYTPEELDQMSDRLFIRQALREGVAIYEYAKEPSRG